MSITKERKSELMTKHAVKKGDTGSVEVQCAVLTDRITSLTEHFKGNHKDHQSKRGLLVMVTRRRKLLSYLKKKDEARYKKLIAALGLRK